MLIVRRITDGIVNHFPIRKSEWGMGLAAFGMGLVLRFQPEMFSAGRSFEILARMAQEATWGMFAVSIFCVRVIALGVNGTFQGFGISPHLRLAASIMGLLFWSQFLLGILIAAIYHGGAWSGVSTYAVLCFFECCNISQSALDRKRASTR